MKHIDRDGESSSSMKRSEVLISPFTRYYVLGVLFLGNALSYLDRQIISIVLEPIKRELRISDTLLGLLGGFSFAVFYATLGIPIATLADYRSRRVIISASMAVWSAMTALCGFTQNFLQLLFARFGVGIGEAGFTPAALSLVADVFPKRTRARAIGIFSAGAMAGTALGFIVAGWALESIGWRGVMLIAGAPGLAFALLVWFTVPEPLRGFADGEASTPSSSRPKTLRSAGLLWKTATFRNLAIGSGMSSFAMYGAAVWMPTFLMRSHAMSPADIGSILGPVMGGLGALSLLASGYAADRLVLLDQRWLLWVPSIASLIAAPLLVAAFFVASPALAIALFGCGYFSSLFVMPATMAVIPLIVPINARASGMAWKLLMTNLLGNGLGPLFVGFLSSSLVASTGTDSLRYAVLWLLPAFLSPCLFFWWASRRLLFDLRR